MYRFVIALTLLISGCAQTLFVKPGGTPAEFERDKFDCEQRVVTMYGGYAQMGPGHAIMAGDDIRRCLTTKGWRPATAAEQARATQTTPTP